jgi:hypothetical protein
VAPHLGIEEIGHNPSNPAQVEPYAVRPDIEIAFLRHDMCICTSREVVSTAISPNGFPQRRSAPGIDHRTGFTGGNEGNKGSEAQAACGVAAPPYRSVLETRRGGTVLQPAMIARLHAWFTITGRVRTGLSEPSYTRPSDGDVAAPGYQLAA